jgi:hypothetical protein
VSEISHHVDKLVKFAIDHPEMIFLVTEIGCGLAKYSPKDIAPLFRNAVVVENIFLPEKFWDILNK